MKFSVITVTLNTVNTIEECIQSVRNQSYRDVEHVIIDGKSSDGTMDIINRYKKENTTVLSERDSGIYQALNKGIQLATGDIIGILHGDDLYTENRVLEKVAVTMEANNCVCCYGDLNYVDRQNIDKTIRVWKSKPFKPGLFLKGWMPPHPTLFVKKRVYEEFGYFDTSFRIAADYELMLRFLEKAKITSCYIPHPLVEMRSGGVSNRSLQNLLKKSSEDYRALGMNGINHRWFILFLKNIQKLPQFFLRG